MKTKLSWITSLALGSIAFVAAGCFGSSPSSQAPSPAPSPAASAAPSSSGTYLPHGDPREQGDPALDAIVLSLPACGDAPLLTTEMTPPTDLFVINPLGKWNPPGNHVFPVDHHYVIMKRPPNDPDPNDGLASTLVSPAKMRVVQISEDQVINNGVVFRTDHSMTVWVCDHFEMVFHHIQKLDPAFAAKVGPIDQNCSSAPADGSGNIDTSCGATPNIDVDAGEVIGQTVSYDLGAYDYRIQPKLFIHGPTQSSYVVSAFDYYPAAIQAEYAPFFGAAVTAGQDWLPTDFVPRTAAPIHGDIAYDVPGTAQGLWYMPNNPESADGSNAALSKDYLDPDHVQAFSLGKFVGSQYVGVYLFSKTHAGLVNRDFAEVKGAEAGDGNIYCYDGHDDPNGPASRGFDPFLGPTGTIILIQLQDSSTQLKLEVQPSQNGCGQGPWAFTDAAVVFER